MSLLGKADYDTEQQMLKEAAEEAKSRQENDVIISFILVDQYNNPIPVVKNPGKFAIINLPRKGEYVRVEAQAKVAGEKNVFLSGQVLNVRWDYCANYVLVECDWRVEPCFEKY